MPFCTTCGKQNPDTAKFCTGCGASLIAIADKITIVQPANNNTKWFIIAGVVVLAGISSYFLFFNNKGKGKVTDKPVTDSAVIASPSIPPFVQHAEYALPQELLYTGKRETVQNEMKYYPLLFPIGWSRDGKFAAVEVTQSDTEEGYFFNIYIQDMVTDKAVWKWNFHGLKEDGYSSEPDSKKDFERVWVKNKNLFFQQLNSFQIEPVTVTNLEKLPVQFGGNQVSFSVNNTTFYSSDFAVNMIQSASIYCITDGSQNKRVFYKTYEQYSNPLSNKLLGYIKAPYENRVLLMLLTEYRGWEGIPTEMNINLIGCDLNNLKF